MAYLEPYKIQHIPKVFICHDVQIIQCFLSQLGTTGKLIFTFSQVEISNKDNFKLVQNVTSTQQASTLKSHGYWLLLITGYVLKYTFLYSLFDLTLRNTNDPRASLRKHTKCLKGPWHQPTPTQSLPFQDHFGFFGGNTDGNSTLGKQFCIACYFLPGTSGTREAAAASLCDQERRAFIYKDGNSPEIQRLTRNWQSRWAQWGGGGVGNQENDRCSPERSACPPHRRGLARGILLP